MLDNLKSYSFWNKILVVVRIILIGLPLNGYIHPDEYFQSTEIMAHDIFDYKGTRTWEWNNTFPARNLLFPIMSAGLPFWLIKQVKTVFNFQMSAELLLITPRRFMMVFILITEKIFMSLYKVDNKSDKQRDFGLFLFRSSHVCLVFLTRTFSNTFETLLYTMLLHLTLRKLNFRSTFLQDFTIGSIISAGFFIRPSFLGFAFYPMLHLSISMLVELPLQKFIMKGFQFAVSVVSGFLVGSLLNMVLDHYYFSSVSNSIWPVTPWNLILYNTNLELLKQHGIHPRYLHLTLNMFLMFGPLYIEYLTLVAKKVSHLWKSMIDGSRKSSELAQSVSSNDAPSCTDRNDSLSDKSSGLSESVTGNDASSHISQNNSSSVLMLMSAITPVLMLSLIPHQEPRYIVGIIIPLIYYISCNISQNGFTKNVSLWIIFNLFGIFWFGFIHQAGIFPAVSFLNKQFRHPEPNVTNHVIFWKTYMPPQHLLAIDSSRSDVIIYDYSSTSIDQIMLKVVHPAQSVDVALMENKHMQTQKMWLICPSSQDEIISDYDLTPWNLEKQFFPHVSMEHLPDDVIRNFKNNLSFETTYNEIKSNLTKGFSLNMYLYIINSV